MRLLAASALILVHSWYPTECCYDRDCHSVPCHEISATEGGYVWHSPKFGDVAFARHLAQSPPAPGCHVCTTDEGIGLCIFVPLGA